MLAERGEFVHSIFGNPTFLITYSIVDISAQNLGYYTVTILTKL